MKLWLPGLALLTVCASVHAENYRIVQSPSQKLDVWIDNIADNTPKSWCARELPLRIVANGDKKTSVLNSFLPRVGSLLENQCGTLTQVRWKLTDPQGATLAEGTADKAKEWAPVVTSTGSSTSAATSTVLTPPTGRAEDLSPQANRAPWQEFTLQDGCHLRTFWQGDASAPALFIPAKEDGKCEKGGWLNGRSEVTSLSDGVEKKTTMTFVHGFPVSGLSENVDADRLLITTVNNERMVVSEGTLAQSWMILPYVHGLNGWKANGTVAVEISRDVASDETRLRARLEEVRKVWTPWFEPGTRLNILLIDSLHPQLRDPAVGTYKTLN
ncbi:hypothetical protein GA0061071_107175 [Kosakonia oryzendophytica]|uniref:Type VI secretion system-associated protein n=1 Tax=Kosakonia oryzendophytica TaxID=1005665 RepID=A0A1C4CEP7_9ENTR|nr:hypothetical protein [Kosakonia oryzendophytica]TDT59269.1 hypothetical protein DFO53_0840 [Enterobacter sp. AG5470]WBT60216.1 hypothetical protein O9K67_10815 [Kosakonia oryzendophytica]SCC17637.1 hypothetical protein GA0061071_107175 [Kosakonia oryzendophytica]